MADEEIQSLITDEHRAYIGRKAEPKTFVVQPEVADRMRNVLEDGDPRWAEGTGIAPPYILAQIDPARSAVAPPILPGRLMTQHEWKFERHVRIGEELTAIAQVTDIRERLGGRYGYSILVSTQVEFFDTEGKLVATASSLGTQFDPKKRRDE